MAVCVERDDGLHLGNWLISENEGEGKLSEVQRMNSLSRQVAIPPLSGLIIIFITTQTLLFWFRRWRGKIIGFFPTNNAFTPELN